jgi:ankyrin repeat protein
MKKTILITALFLISCICSKAQSLNDQLYDAVKEKDTLLVEKLLIKGADANYSKKQGQAEMPLLVFSVINDDYKTVKLLIDYKANVNKKDWFNTTALMYSANNGDLKIIKYLLDNGADIHASDGQGNTVLSAAKEGNHPDAIRFIENSLSKN